MIRRTTLLLTVCLSLACGSAAVPARGAEKASSGFRAGVARVVITPRAPMWAAGYASRTVESAEKEHDLFAKALVIEDVDGTRLVMVTTDLLGLPKNIADPVAAEIGRRWNLRRDQICLSASHTHCGPVLRDSLPDIYMMLPEDWEAKVEPYSRELEKKLVDVVAAAMADLSPATLMHGQGQATFAVNRRENYEARLGTPGQVLIGPVDHAVPVLAVKDAAGNLKAALFGYACHCTTMSYEKWSGDYAGFAQINVEAAHPGLTAMFFAGCGGDANPLPRRKIELCRDYGRQLADAVEAVLGEGLEPLSGDLRSAFAIVDLPFADVPTRADLERQRDSDHRYESARARRFLKMLDDGGSIPSSYPYPVQAWQLGDGPTLVVLGGEVVVDYDLRLKRETPGGPLWVMAYANDVMAYIPSRRVLAEGGYEGRDSMAIYGQPSVWAPAVEELVIGKAGELIERVRRER